MAAIQVETNSSSIRPLLRAFTWRASVATALLFLVAACGGDNKLKSMGDFELASRQAECLDRRPTSPGKATACENVRRECERRKQELGSYICRHN